MLKVRRDIPKHGTRANFKTASKFTITLESYLYYHMRYSGILNYKFYADAHIPSVT
jgi:hypothetical protein